MGNDATSSVVDDSGRHHQLDNVSVHDASVFPTSIGASPQLSVCALAARFSAALGRSLHRG
jgi:choline dehydrogenase-like flavoprotein